MKARDTEQRIRNFWSFLLSTTAEGIHLFFGRDGIHRFTHITEQFNISTDFCVV